MSKHYFEASSFDQLYRDLLLELSEFPQHVCSPRGMGIKENLGVVLRLKNPRDRLLSSEKRAANYGFAVGEFLWYWAGKQDLETMLYYNKRMKDFSDDGKTLNSAYGYRLRDEPVFITFTSDGELTQWDSCIKTLVDDPDSRRAVMLINRPEDEGKAVLKGSKDVPCTLSLQFFIRNNKLDLHINMRSNDAVWGLTYDLFSFTLFQELMLLDLKKHGMEQLELGEYVHHAGSMHIYERHFTLARDIINEYREMVQSKHVTPMDPINSLEEIDHLLKFEEAARTRADDDKVSVSSDVHSGAVMWMANQLTTHRCKRELEALNG